MAGHRAAVRSFQGTAQRLAFPGELGRIIDPRPWFAGCGPVLSGIIFCQS